jgi:hypothetical protein
VNGTVAQQLEVLEDDAHLSAKGWDVSTLQTTEVVIQDKGIVGLVNIQLKIERLEQCGLSGANTSDNVDELAFIDVEVNFLEYEYSVFLTDVCFLVIY